MFAIQKRLFEKIKTRVPTHASIEHEIAKQLDISVEQAYFYLRGQTELSLEKAYALALHFGISLDTLHTERPTVIPFRFQALEYNLKTMDGYFKSVLDELSAVNRFGSREMNYAANDLPIFALFQFPELATFRLFFWGKMVYNLPEFRQRKFSFDCVDRDTLAVGERLWLRYLKMPSVEIWDSNIINEVLKQIFYFWKNNIFKQKEDALQICDALLAFINHTEQQAEIGKKFHPYRQLPKHENYQLYYNEVSLTNNIIFLNSDDSTMTFVSQNALNYLATDNSIFCMQTEMWLHHLRQQSTLISGQNEELRQHFFNGIRSNIEYVKEQIG